jgi:sec-independent protein translocase protein TatA
VGSVGLPELILILLIVLLVFGAKRLPEIARSVGKSSKAFKEGMRDGASDSDEAEDSKKS